MLPSNKNILFIYSARFGDILMSTPTLRTIKEYWKNSNITFLTHPSRKEILEHSPLINKIGAITNRKAYFSKLTAKKIYDIAFVINKDNEEFVKYAQNYSKYTIAFSTNNKKIDDKLFIHEAYPKQHSKHSVDMRLTLLQNLNIFPSTKQLEYIVTDNEKTWAKDYLKEINQKFLIGIQANSFHTKSYRNWPIQNFIDLCNKIKKEKTNTHFLLFGSKDDIKNLLPLKNELKRTCSMLAGSLTLRQTAAIMDNINLYIGVDTGPTHIMGTLNKPMIVLYHSFNSSTLLKPLENPQFIAIDHPLAELGAKEPPMSDISVQSVFDQVKKFL
jgi:heptosyltransferase-3